MPHRLCTVVGEAEEEGEGSEYLGGYEARVSGLD